MRFEALYRISFDLMLFLATFALCVDVVADQPLAPLYPIAVAVAAVVSYWLVDRGGFGLNRDLANILAIGTIGLSYLEYQADSSQLVAVLGHWLVYLQLLKMFLPKSVEDDWFLFLLALTQAVVGAFQPGEWVGLVLAVWALSALWVLGLFHLRREADRARLVSLQSQSSQPRTLADAAPASRIDLDPYPGLVDRSFLVSTTNVALLTLALGGLIFLLMPRWDNQRTRRIRGQAVTPHLTGFSDSVKLGQLGQILENEDVVLTVEIFDESDRRVVPEFEPLWRGVTLNRYEAGSWYRTRTTGLEFELATPTPTSRQRSLRQVIKLEQTDSDVLFGLRPVLWASGPDLVLNQFDGTLFRQDLRPGAPYLTRANRNPGRYSYTVLSNADGNARQPFELQMAAGGNPELLEVPEPLRQHLEPIVTTVLAGVSDDSLAQAEALERYLRDGEFSYSLRLNVVDPGIDPVEDFLVNRKEGHCEYFASALALLLRTAGIPARLVNGFKGGDWNDLGQVLSVRQKHAHSWVEALVSQPGGPRRRARWKTLDPTPALQRAETLASVGGVGARFHFATDYLRYLWVFYVVGFDADRQERIIYGPIKALFSEAARGFRLMGSALRRGLDWLLHFPTLGSVFSLRGFLVAVLTMCLLLGISRVLAWIIRRLRKRWRNEALDPGLASGFASYRRLSMILKQLGQVRRGTETSREFVERATAAAARDGVELADLPPRVVEAYYRVRFGGGTIAAETLREIEARLDAIEATLAAR